METKYRSLRLVATLLKVLAWIALVLGIVGALVLIGAAAYFSFNSARVVAPLGSMARTGGLSLVNGIAGGIGVAFASLLYFLSLSAASDMIQLQMDIEQNTREMANALRPRP